MAADRIADTHQREDTGPGEPAAPDAGVEARVQQSIQEDPVLRFLFQQQWRILTVIAALAAVYYLQGVYQNTRLSNRQQTADSYAELREAWQNWSEQWTRIVAAAGEGEPVMIENLPEAQQARLDAARVRLGGRIKELQARERPYAEIAMLYEDLYGIERGDWEETFQKLSQLPWREKQRDRRSGLIFELRSLAAARALLDSPEHKAAAWRVLLDLARAGRYVAAAAGQTLALAAGSSEEKEEALAALNAVITAQPEQEALLEDEIQRLRLQGGTTG